MADFESEEHNTHEGRVIKSDAFTNSSFKCYASDCSDGENLIDEVSKEDITFFKSTCEDESYQDELFGAKKLEELQSTDGKVQETENCPEQVNLELKRNLVDFRSYENEVPFFQDLKQTLRSQSIQDYGESEVRSANINHVASDDSIFESVSVAYENRIKHLEKEKQKENELENTNSEEFEAFDENLMRELLEFSINDQGQQTSTKQNISMPLYDHKLHDFSTPKENCKNNLMKQGHLQMPAKNMHLQESQKRLEKMLNRLNGRRGIHNQHRPRGDATSQARETHRPPERSASSCSKGINFSKSELSRNATQAPKPLSSRIASSRSQTSSLFSTPRPAFRAGSLMDFSRKINEDGRRAVAGKNNPYWKLRPSSSHKTTYVDEMLFGPQKSGPTWEAPWQERSKSTKPYFCDWVWDRRKIPKKA